MPFLGPDVLTRPVERGPYLAGDINRGSPAVRAVDGISHVDLLDDLDGPARIPGRLARCAGQVIAGDVLIARIADARVQEALHDLPRVPSLLRAGRDSPDEVGVLGGVLWAGADRAGR